MLLRDASVCKRLGRFEDNGCLGVTPSFRFTVIRVLAWYGSILSSNCIIGNIFLVMYFCYALIPRDDLEWNIVVNESLKRKYPIKLYHRRNSVKHGLQHMVTLYGYLIQNIPIAGVL